MAPSDNSVLEQWRQPYRDGVLTREEMERYWDEGYLLKHDLIPAELLEAVKQAISRCSDPGHPVNQAPSIILPSEVSERQVGLARATYRVLR